MKKKAGVCFVLCAALLCFPCGPHATAAEDSFVIDMHGTKTYLGAAADWAKTWDEENFKDVTGKDVDCDDNLILKAGTVQDIDAGIGTVTVSGGSAANIRSFGAIAISGGTVRGSAASKGDGVVLSGTVNVRGSVTADRSVVFASGTAAVGGSVTGEDIAFRPKVSVKIGGTVTGYGTTEIGDCSLTAKRIDSAGSGTLKLSGYQSTLPQLANLADILVNENGKIICRQPVTAQTLTLKHGSEFVAYAEVTLDSLAGPGTLCVNPGALTVRYGLEELPVLIFNSPVENGTVAFRSDGSFISTSSACIYGYDLTEVPSGSGVLYKLHASGSYGLALSAHRVSLGGKSPAALTAATLPALSKYAEGTKIVWELHGDTEGISMNASNQICSLTGTGSHRAVVVAYLVDRNNTRLDGYRSDSCIVMPAEEAGASSGLGEKFLSDTTAPLAVDGSYTFKITSLDGKAPSFAVGTAGIFSAALINQEGADYYFRLTATGAPGSDAGIYVDGGTRLLVATVKRSAPSAVCDTTGSFRVKSGQSYVFQITAQDTPVFAGGTPGVFRLEFLRRRGNDRYYRITAVGRRGDSCGFYLNGSKKPVAVATIG